MEEMQKDLYELLDEGFEFSEEIAVDLILQIAEGIKHIHSKGMVHRDLKPRNILVNLAEPSSSQGSSSSRILLAKIADFGLTKTKDASFTCSNQTLDVGTVRYMAPEVIRGEDDPYKIKYNPRKADVFSFTIMCYEILAGKDSTYGQDVFESIPEFQKKVKEGTNSPNLPENCSLRLASLIRRCWAGLSSDRPLFPEICRELRYIKGLVLRGKLTRSYFM